MSEESVSEGCITKIVVEDDGTQSIFEFGPDTSRRLADMLRSGINSHENYQCVNNEHGKARAVADTIEEAAGAGLMTDGGEEDAPTCVHGRMTKGISNCYADATHTGGDYYPGPVCEDHTVDGSVPLSEDDDDLVTDGGQPALKLTDDGIEIPDGVDLSEGVVFRARGATVDHKPGSADRPFYPAIDEDHLEAEQEYGVINEHLDAYEVSIKPYGEEPETYHVQVPATDGGVEHEPGRPALHSELRVLTVVIAAGFSSVTAAVVFLASDSFGYWFTSIPLLALALGSEMYLDVAGGA